MKIEALDIPEVSLICQQVYGDQRGYFMEIFNVEKWKNAQLVSPCFVQDNISFSEKPGTIRGLHYQIGKNAQAKLFQCLQGEVLDVVLDVRRSSPHFGKHVSVRLSGGSGHQILIPPGFAHGFETLKPNTIVQYKVSAPYDPKAERGILWNDPQLGVEWQVGPEEAILSDKDRQWPLFSQAEYF